MGGWRKRQQVLSANRQKHPRWRGRQGGDGAVDVGDALPLVARLRLPSRALKRQQRHAGRRTGIDGIATHLRGKRMGRVHQVGNALRLQPVAQTSDAAKATNAGRQRLGDGRSGAAGVRKNRIAAGISQSARQLAGLGGATQQQNTGRGTQHV